MKKINIILLTTICLFLSGCFIKSLYPFYTKKDIVYDPKIIGTWLDSDSSKWIIKQQMKWPVEPDSSYQIEIVEKKGKQGSFNAHLFRLNHNLYLDFFPNGKIGSNDFVEMSIILTHSLAKIQYSGNNIKIQWFNEIWMGQLLDQNKIRIKHETINDNSYGNNERSYLLTASTEELQKFIIKYGNDTLAFKSIWEKNQKERNKEALTYNLKKISNETN
jgi:hypothetical protein